jgi:thioredoxin 1
MRTASVFLFITLGFMAAGCAKSEDRREAQLDPAGQALVTFVELGSVNCIPCRAMQPVMRAVESEYRGQVRVVFHDVWTEEGAPYGKKYNIRAIPTQVFLDSSGVEFYRHEGYFPKEQLVEVLKMKGVK